MAAGGPAAAWAASSPEPSPSREGVDRRSTGARKVVSSDGRVFFRPGTQPLSGVHSRLQAIFAPASRTVLSLDERRPGAV